MYRRGHKLNEGLVAQGLLTVQDCKHDLKTASGAGDFNYKNKYNEGYAHNREASDSLRNLGISSNANGHISRSRRPRSPNTWPYREGQRSHSAVHNNRQGRDFDDRPRARSRDHVEDRSRSRSRKRSRRYRSRDREYGRTRFDVSAFNLWFFFHQLFIIVLSRSRGAIDDQARSRREHENFHDRSMSPKPLAGNEVGSKNKELSEWVPLLSENDK
jgi:hypothetical protein